MPAPVPTRAPVAPMQPAQTPQGGMWTPEMGIKFSGGPQEQQTPLPGQKPVAGQWDPSAGIRFG